MPEEVARNGVFAIIGQVISESTLRTETVNKMLFKKAQHDVASAQLKDVDAEVDSFLENVSIKRAQIECAVQTVEALNILWTTQVVQCLRTGCVSSSVLPVFFYSLLPFPGHF